MTLATPMLVGVETAYAQCLPTNIVSGNTVICSGSETGGVGNGFQSNIRLIVLEGANVTRTGANSTAIILNSNGSVVNLGTIGGNDDGIEAAVNLTLTNIGTISGDNQGVDAGSISSLTNSGTISGGIDGVDGGTISSLTNSGTISGGDVGVTAFRILSLTNSGTISGGDFAIEVTNINPGSNDTTLTLNAGSILIGHVDLGRGTNTLNIGEGLSLNSMFEAPDGNSTVPILGTTSGHLVAVLDQTTGARTERQVVAIDPSAFASFDDALAALVSGIGQTVQGRQAALRSDPALGFASSFASRYAAAQEESLVAFSDLDLDNTPHLNPNRFWIEGFGAYREDDSNRVGRTFESLTGGLVAGVDVPLDAITSVGVMAGFAASRSENETDTQETDTMSYYAGVYVSTEAWGLAWDASLTLGYTDYDQERITANNLVATGLETASADFGGWFINPQVTVTNSTSTGLSPTATGLMGFALPTIEQSLTLAYAGLFLDGTTETGTTNPLTLDDRDVHIASARAALALPFEALHANGALTTISLIGGIEARTQFGDDAISGTLLGQTVSTTLDDDDTALGGFLGLAGEHQTSSGLTAYANAEAMLETNSAYQISATAGLRIAF
ncbi:autotransporter domain-containing protein [Ahrensia marina]|uniref:autotransporter outer membrane beta-barrel domain-containing protein n=1 Tax=Ahrensia marina TaxID=1514904 RepID=UPI0035CF94BF